ncbi:MAG: hypothetical protein QXT33_03400 [Thermofilum sp.]
MSAEEVAVALKVENIILLRDVRLVTEEGVAFLHAGKLLNEKIKRVLEEALPR